MSARISELTGEQQNRLHAAAVDAGERIVIHVGLDGALLFTVGSGPAAQEFDSFEETIAAFNAITAARNGEASPC